MEISNSFILFAITAAITPGPNNIMIMASGMNFGVRASLSHYFGVCLGVPLVFLAIGYGLGYLFERYAVLHLIIKVGGVCYLVYLAWRIATSEPATLKDGGSLEGGRSRPLSFLQAMTLQWVNPKSYIVGTSVFAIYTTAGQDINGQILAIVLVMFVVTIVGVGIWMMSGAVLKRFLTKSSYQKAFNIMMAGLLMVAIWPIIKELIEAYLF